MCVCCCSWPYFCCDGCSVVVLLDLHLVNDLVLGLTIGVLLALLAFVLLGSIKEEDAAKEQQQQHC